MLVCAPPFDSCKDVQQSLDESTASPSILGVIVIRRVATSEDDKVISEINRFPWKQRLDMGVHGSDGWPSKHVANGWPSKE